MILYIKYTLLLHMNDKLYLLNKMLKERSNFQANLVWPKND